MTSSDRQEHSFHYAWIVVVTGTIVIMACLGFGRFALGMLLPSMASSLKLSYAQIGYISTGNFIGYLASVLLCAPIAKRMGSRRLIVSALALIASSMALISQRTVVRHCPFPLFHNRHRQRRRQCAHDGAHHGMVRPVHPRQGRRLRRDRQRLRHHHLGQAHPRRQRPRRPGRAGGTTG